MTELGLHSASSAGPPTAAVTATPKKLKKENSDNAASSSEDERAPMERALRAQIDECTPKKDDKASGAASSPQEAILEAENLLRRFRDEVTKDDLIASAQPVKKGVKKPLGFEDLLQAKSKELDQHIQKARKKQMLVMAGNLTAKSQMLVGAKLVFSKAKMFALKNNESSKRAFKQAVSQAKGRNDFSEANFPIYIKELFAEASGNLRSGLHFVGLDLW